MATMVERHLGTARCTPETKGKINSMKNDGGGMYELRACVPAHLPNMPFGQLTSARLAI